MSPCKKKEIRSYHNKHKEEKTMDFWVTVTQQDGIPAFQKRGSKVKCVCVSPPKGADLALKALPLFWQFDETHIAEAEVNEVLQKLLADFILDGLME